MSLTDIVCYDLAMRRPGILLDTTGYEELIQSPSWILNSCCSILHLPGEVITGVLVRAGLLVPVITSSKSLPDSVCYDPAPAPRLGLRRLASTQAFVPAQISIPMSRTDTGRYDSTPAPVFRRELPVTSITWARCIQLHMLNISA